MHRSDGPGFKRHTVGPAPAGRQWVVGFALAGVLFAVTAPAGEPVSNRFEFSRPEMGVPVRVVLYAPDNAAATTAAEAAFARIAELNSILSDYDPESELRRLGNATSEGKSVPVSKDLWRVLVRSQDVSTRSDGAFDVTVGPVVRLWRRARRRGQLPAPDRLAAARKLVGYQLLQLDQENRSVKLGKPDMWLDLGGIAKGYAVDEALAVLRKHGISRALVDAGGDMVLGAPPPGKQGWRIGIAPLEPDGPPSQILSLANVAVATSGDTWQFVVIDGRRYSHIVDPKTGVGLTDHSSVTVVAPDGITADSLASAVSVLGPNNGLKLIEATPNTEAFIVRAPKAKPETHQSTGWKGLPRMESK